MCKAVGLFLAISFFTNPSAYAAESFGSYESLSHRLMNLVGSAKEKVWLRTTYLTDGHLVMGLNLAQFRDVDIKVTLHSKRAKHYMSRYNNLKKQNIATAISGDSWSYPTTILVDNVLYNISTALNYKSNTRYIKLNKSHGNSVSEFEKEFLKDSKFKVYKTSSPKKSLSKPIVRTNEPTTKNDAAGKNVESVYTYTNKKKSAPRGVQTKLPRKTKWQLNR